MIGIFRGWLPEVAALLRSANRVAKRRGYLLAAALLLLAGAARAENPLQPVSIVLRDRAVVARRCVRLGDVADLQGGPEALRRQLADVDVDDLPATEAQARACSRTQIQYRLRLAGIPVALFNVSGSREVLIVPDRRPLSAPRVVESAREELLRRLPWQREELSVSLAQPITVVLPTAAEDESIELEAEPHRPITRPGNIPINVAI